ncbi:MAG: RNA polymerase sigma factor [Akkermansiaceae bacterium]|nr:RNA polymerase sigma factor [Akkermansiaceae bacterium]
MDLAEFEHAIQTHRRSVLAYAYTCCKDMALAEDIVQEACLTAHQKRDSYRPDASFSSWLISIARFIWLRECEKRGIRARAMNYIEKNAETLFTPELYEEEQWQHEKAALRTCLKKLPAEDRRIIEDHFVKCRKYAAIAESISRTLTWVKVRMYRLREALRNCIREKLNTREAS